MGTLRVATLRFGRVRDLAPGVLHNLRRDRRDLDWPVQERFLCLPFSGGVERDQEFDFARRKDRDRQSVAIKNAIARQYGELRTRGEDADQVERIGT